MTSQLTIEDALARVLAHVEPLEAEDVPVAAATGRVLTRPRPPRPTCRRSTARRWTASPSGRRTRPARLRVVGQSAAGRPFDGTLGEGEAVAISTGAVVPPGADAVVPVEVARLAGGTVAVDTVSPGSHVRRRGGDAVSGALVLAAGTRIRPAHVGALAAAGRRESCGLRAGRASRCSRPAASCGRPARCWRRERSTKRTHRSSRRNSRLRARTSRCSQPVVDDPEATERAFERGLAADVLVTSGGVSVGPHDLVRSALARLGVDEVFWRVAVRPGKPVAFGVRGRTLVFGLPGNPVSSLVGCELFVRPAVLALQGAAEPGPFYLPGTLATTVRRDPQRAQLIRARVRVEQAGVVLEPLQGQESHMIATAAAADALVLIESGEGELPAGATVRYLPCAADDPAHRQDDRADEPAQRAARRALAGRRVRRVPSCRRCSQLRRAGAGSRA